MACPLLLINDDLAKVRADGAAAGGNVWEVVEAAAVAGENVREMTSENARAPAADGKVWALDDAAGVPA